MTPLWLAKHQAAVPSVLLSFFAIASDPSQANLQDNQLKSSINSIKTTLAKSGFKTRFAAVFVADQDFAITPELDDRLAAIRRATALDTKTGLFFLPPASRTELASFVASTLVALQPVCVDYYRDLTKHVRRKKGRGYVPHPTASARGTSQSLNLHGWNVRYDFKLAVFAEFRQEMDAAQRHYEAALEELFGPEGILETTPSWSPRWNDARLLCDVVAFRILRCQVWRGMTTGAAESWSNYKDRMKDLVDRRGKGTDGYGWEAWEARWAKMMAQLIEMADLPAFKLNDARDDEPAEAAQRTTVFALPEKAYSTMDRLPPFHHLHHPGYWWRLASKHILNRRRKAEAIPVEDRTPLEDVPATQAASRVRTYDTYLVPPPHEELPASGLPSHDYLVELQTQSARAESEFGSRGQARAVQQVKLELAREMIRLGRYDEAFDVVRPVWVDMAWRMDGWFSLAAEVLQIIHSCAAHVPSKKLNVQVTWEMACEAFHVNLPIDIMHSLGSGGETDEQSLVSLSSESLLSPVSLEFAFLARDGFVGESAAGQLAITFNASNTAKPIVLSEVRVHFSTNFRGLFLTHEESTQSLVSLITDLREEQDPSHPMAKSLHGIYNLRLVPRQTLVMNFLIPLRTADDLSATGASITLSGSSTTLEYNFARPADIRSRYLWLQDKDSLVKKRLHRSDTNTITILPKPPRIEMRILNLMEQYFTGEQVLLEIEVVNDEDEEVDVTLQATMKDDSDGALKLSWLADAQETASTPEGLHLGMLATAKSMKRELVLKAPVTPSRYSLNISVVYHMVSDDETPLSKQLTLDMSFVSPFEANYDFLPRLHRGDYPNPFHLPEEMALDDSGNIVSGIEQRWCLASKIASFASESLTIESTSLVVNRITSNARCTLDDASESKQPIVIGAHGMMNVNHILNVCKISLDDRRVSALDLSLSINWRRQNAAPGGTTEALLAVPHLTVPSAEPRVLCTKDIPDGNPDIVPIRYTLENPSMHFLSFVLTMEASEDFAFSGPKMQSLSLTPMSRTSVVYKLLVYEQNDGQAASGGKDADGRWIWPAVKVVDSYFNKTLRVLDGGEGVKSDERGIGIRITAE